MHACTMLGFFLCNCAYPRPQSFKTCINGGCMWFSNFTMAPSVTLPYLKFPELRTYRDSRSC